MKDDKFNAELAQLQTLVNSLPPEQQEQLNKLVEETKILQENLCKNLNGLENTLADLRVNAKYLISDLEATRRENIELRKLLDQ